MGGLRAMALCADQHAVLGECAGWAEDGECANNTEWMHENCRRSCGMCPDQTSVEMWVGFNILVAGLLLLDLHLSSRSSCEQMRHAALWSAVWVGLAVAFALFLAATKDESAGYTFLVGYLVEKTLSVDNLLVMLIFKSFRIPPHHQPCVLKWGILGAIIMRAIFIVAGVRLIETFDWMVPLFGLTLLVAAYKMIRENKDDDVEADYSNSFLVRGLKLVVSYDEDYVGGEFFSRNIGSTVSATPLLAALLIVEFSDVVFAIDSIP